MSIFKHSYSGLITKGLGLPACLGMITMGFHLFVGTVEVIVPPVQTPTSLGGHGGGRPNVLPTYGRRDDEEVKKRIRVTVKFKDSKRWIREYDVSDDRARIAIRAMRFLNTIAARVRVGIDHVRAIRKQVSAVFTRSDK